MVEHVIAFQAQLNVLALASRPEEDVLVDREISVVDSGTMHGIAMGVAKRADRRISEAGGIEPEILRRTLIHKLDRSHLVAHVWARIILPIKRAEQRSRPRA